jgi:hypothetical protein
MAYRARLPLRSVGGGVSDDRGVYRIAGLSPGKYWVRSAGHVLEDASGWLPTFGPQSREIRDARVHDVAVDADTPYADISPSSGVLAAVGGAVTYDSPVPVMVTISSEVAQQRVQTGCGGGYQFHGLAPGEYEIFAMLQDSTASAFIETRINRNTRLDLSLTHSPTVDVEIRRAGANASMEADVKLTVRRIDASEAGTSHVLTGRRMTMTPGAWEVRAQPPAGFYVDLVSTNVGGFARSRRRREISADAFEILIEPRLSQQIRVSISDQPAQIAGQVLVDAKPSPGTPVFLWPVAVSARRSLSGAPETLSDIEGHFRFAGLPPGEYRVLASFDVSEMDEELAELSRSPVIHAKAGETAPIELSLWVAPW